MKLNKDNFNKTIEGDVITYTYRCNETDFFLVVSGGRSDRQLNVFKGSLENKEEELVTSDSLEAWNYFETLLEICQPKQSSSGGGGGQKPEENPKLLPLLAIRFNQDSNMWDCTLFVVLEDNTQQDVFSFSVNPKTMPNILPTKKVFTVDWSNEEIPLLLKSEVLLKDYPTIKFETHSGYEVFLFIPKSLVNQGGEEGGATEEPQGEGEPSDEDGEDKGDKKRKNKDQKGKPSKDGEPSDEDDEDGEPSDEDGEDKGDKKRKNKDQKGKPSKDGEPSDEDDEDGEPSDEDGEPKDKKGKPNDKKGKRSKFDQSKGDDEEDDDGEPSDEDDEDGEPSDKKRKPNDDEDRKPNEQLKPIEKKLFGKIVSKSNAPLIIQQLASSTETKESVVKSVLRNVESGEMWLQENNFPKIIKDLNLPNNITALELSTQIINAN